MLKGSETIDLFHKITDVSPYPKGQAEPLLPPTPHASVPLSSIGKRDLSQLASEGNSTHDYIFEDTKDIIEFFSFQTFKEMHN